jgi:hypothetical protein
MSGGGKGARTRTISWEDPRDPAPRLAPEEPNVYSHGHQADGPAPGGAKCFLAMSKSSAEISLLTELAEIS